MKNQMLSLLFTGLLLGACSDEDTPQSQVSSIDNNGVLKGVIADFRPGSVDSVKAINRNGDVLGASAVDSSGAFVISQTDEAIVPTEPLADYLMTGFEGTITPKNALIATLGVAAYKDGQELGALYKSNFKLKYPSMNDQFQSSFTDELGSAISSFYYSPSSIKVKGISNMDVNSPVSSGIYIHMTRYSFDYMLKPGWNEIVTIYTQYTAKNPVEYLFFTYTQIIPVNMTWKLLSNPSYDYNNTDDYFYEL
jgi:hypothetical protein